MVIHNNLNPTLRVPLVVHQSKYRLKKANTPVAKNPAPDYSPINKSFKNGLTGSPLDLIQTKSKMCNHHKKEIIVNRHPTINFP